MSGRRTDHVGETRSSHTYGAVSGDSRRRPITVAEHVSESIRRSILNGHLEGGARLSLAGIAEAFAVSTTPVRVALRNLSLEGLVDTDAYRGAVVRTISRREVEEIVRIRQALEPLAVVDAVENMTEDVLTEAEQILRSMEDAKTWDDWVDGNRAFHQKLYEAATSKRLVEIITILQNTQVAFVSATLSHSPFLEDAATEDHHMILEAARRGDARQMTDVTLRHLAIPIRPKTSPTIPE